MYTPRISHRTRYQSPSTSDVNANDIFICPSLKSCVFRSTYLSCDVSNSRWRFLRVVSLTYGWSIWCCRCGWWERCAYGNHRRSHRPLWSCQMVMNHYHNQQASGLVAIFEHLSRLVGDRRSRPVRFINNAAHGPTTPRADPRRSFLDFYPSSRALLMSRLWRDDSPTLVCSELGSRRFSPSRQHFDMCILYWSASVQEHGPSDVFVSTVERVNGTTTRVFENSLQSLGFWDARSMDTRIRVYYCIKICCAFWQL